ncbi:MAG: sortase family protein [uncultured bacterium]|nr:MAG: sortase family protein [uncultured bacterium]OGE16701.1 MAG: hypothetical protein A2858_02595 [Candidatus Daviesbacteria bacterium RIFCSPHIGHO2_01_FULL_36_37]OGE34778.1 MAG: hypothetical protein A3E66_04115 [Candidatus Daviesbacteria bacterium RIFCSPHIGHO2_12_FULL_37_16]
MQATIKYYQPGKVITLFDVSEGLEFCGSLVFAKASKKTRKNKLMRFEKINQKFLEWDKKILGSFKSIEFPKVSKFYPSIATVLLVVSFVSLASVLLPIFTPGLMGNSPKEVTNATKVVEKKWSGESLAEFNARDQREREKFIIKDFRVIIPKINIESNIIPFVDSTNEREYKEQLQNGVAHAKGSYLPYESGPMYLFSHSTDSIFNVVQYNAKFYALKDLVEGDDVSIFLNSKEYKYKVTSREIINPDQIELIHQTEADLVMQTCWPPGTDWQRLIVYAKKV